MKGLHQSIKQITELANEIGRGRLSVALEPRSDHDELVEAFNNMVSTIPRLIGDLNHMTSKHNAVEIDVRIPADTFEGAFRTVADGINEMVTAPIDTNQKAIACMAQFGRGNFEAQLPLFPGKQKRSTTPWRGCDTT
jgi:methyl-accepting chemotaxis protein